MKDELIEALKECKDAVPDELGPKIDELIAHIDRIMALTAKVRDLSTRDDNSLTMKIDQTGVHFTIKNHCCLTLTFDSGAFSTVFDDGTSKDNTPIALFRKCGHACKWLEDMVTAKYPVKKVAATEDASDEEEAVDWHKFHKPSDILRNFPTNPTADDVLDLYLMNKILVSPDVDAHIHRVSGKIKSTVRNIR